MPEELILGLIIYVAIMSVISIAVCIYDKIASRAAKKHRPREATLLGLSALGGSLAILVTMLIIRHKTKHQKFMIGIPVIIVIQAIIVAALCILF